MYKRAVNLRPGIATIQLYDFSFFPAGCLFPWSEIEVRWSKNRTQTLGKTERHERRYNESPRYTGLVFDISRLNFFFGFYNPHITLESIPKQQPRENGVLYVVRIHRYRKPTHPHHTYIDTAPLLQYMREGFDLSIHIIIIIHIRKGLSLVGFATKVQASCSRRRIKSG